MKRKICMLLCVMFISYSTFAQWVVTDPMNFAGNLANSIKEIVQTSTTANNMIKNFEETVKIYEQGKRYYDALKAVNNLVKDARKVQQTMLYVGEVSDIYVTSFQKMLSDPNYSFEELNAIASGYAILLEESSVVLDELRLIINPTTLSLTDKDRMDVVDAAYENARNYRNLVVYYTNKNIGVSYLRAKKKGDTERVLKLYGNPNERYW